jgi:hypothetical protein
MIIENQVFLLTPFFTGAWRKREVDTCIHIHKIALSTRSHAGHVRENAYATPKQAQRNVATKKKQPPPQSDM